MKKPVLKERKCKNCGEKFMQFRPLQYVCSTDCGWELVKKLRDKKEKKEIGEMKKSLLTHKDYIQLLQKVFNTYIRLRDKDLPCVSCGTTKLNIQYHAGHYRSVGANSHLRFNEINCWKQCSRCNNMLSGNLIEYRKELVKRIGEHRVEWLENYQGVLKITIPEIQEKIKYYKKLIAELK